MATIGGLDWCGCVPWDQLGTCVDIGNGVLPDGITPARNHHWVTSMSEMTLSEIFEEMTLAFVSVKLGE